MFQFQELVIVSHIIGLIKMVGVEHQTHRTRREIVQPVPDARNDQQSLIRAVKRVSELVIAVIYGHIKATADGDNELLARVMAVTTPLYPTRHVIDIECALNVKREFNSVIHNSEVTIFMMVPIETDDAAIIDARHAVCIVFVHINAPPHALTP